MVNCSICGRTLNDPLVPESLDCGGDCLKCMAEIGEDPECVYAMRKINDSSSFDTKSSRELNFIRSRK